MKKQLKKTLSICIYTYNRKSVLIPDLKSYLTVKDDRFNIVIQDNASTDGTKEEIEALNDDRIIYRRNETNIGPLPNAIKSLSNNDSEYSMVVIDKDCLYIKKLSAFIDLLETEKPDYGYVELEINKEHSTIAYNGGEEALRRFGFLSKHPSGYFYRSKLWDQEVNKDWFKAVRTNFDFPFDNVISALSLKYNGLIVGNHVITTAGFREIKESKTYTYNPSNFFFAPHMLNDTMSIYLNSLLSQDCDIKLKEIGAKIILRRNLLMNTIGWRNILRNESTCNHYNLTMRKVGIKEMMGNIYNSIKQFIEITKSTLLFWSRVAICISCLSRLLLTLILNPIKSVVKRKWQGK